jgi:pimeloyl-ACP methyl ester carboxylesterase
MIPGALALRGSYQDLTLSVVIIAGEGDRVVFKEMSEQLAANIPHSTLEMVEGAGHMVHHIAPGRILAAVEAIGTTSEHVVQGYEATTLAREQARVAA